MQSFCIWTEWWWQKDFFHFTLKSFVHTDFCSNSYYLPYDLWLGSICLESNPEKYYHGWKKVCYVSGSCILFWQNWQPQVSLHWMQRKHEKYTCWRCNQKFQTGFSRAAATQTQPREQWEGTNVVHNLPLSFPFPLQILSHVSTGSIILWKGSRWGIWMLLQVKGQQSCSSLNMYRFFWQKSSKFVSCKTSLVVLPAFRFDTNYSQSDVSSEGNSFLVVCNVT